MDFESDLSFQTLTDNMAASKAPTTTTNVSSTSSTTTSSSSSSLTATQDICHNFQELCRSCGKTNAELYDLFQTTNSPFNTSSTTCYTHLSNSSSCSTTTTTSTNKQPCSFTAVGSAKSSFCAASTFDSVAATAKATAKGQSNMNNILQEMQIWQLKIKCNDGLPQRICAKCTAQFYMIHKFRRKCLKVQTQLRALNEEQKFYERQQQKENPTTAKDDAFPAIQATVTVTATAPLVEAHDLVNDNYGEQQAAVDNTKSAVSFVTNTGNTNESIQASTRATTLLDNVETMPQKTEANKPTTPTSSATALVSSDKTVEAQEHCTVTRPKDEKKPLLKAAVLNFIKTTPPLTLQQPLAKICDNDATDHTNASKKLCLEQELVLDSHIIFKTFGCPNKTKQEAVLKSCQETDEKMLENSAQDMEDTSSCMSTSTGKNELHNETLKLKINPESQSLFITKAALKAYTATSSEAKNTNDTNNNDHRNKLPSALCDRLSCEPTGNTCSSTSSSTQSPCSSKSSSISRKSHRTRVLRHKAVKYAGNNKRSGYCYKSSNIITTKKMTKITLKKKQRSWQNKHKFKRLVDIRTRSYPSAIRKQLQLKKHKMYNKRKSRPQHSVLQMEDETSSTVSRTSSSTYTSSSSSATTPAVTDLVENHDDANDENLHKTGSSSITEGISSNKSSCIMWKTKAAMKANANDMPVDVVVDKAEPTSNIPATTSFPYTAADTATGSATTLLSLATDNTDISSKTLDENQSISSSTNINHNNNNILMEEHCCSTNTAMSSPHNQVKDTEDESEPNLNHNNLWPEEASQKHINAKNKQEKPEGRKEKEIAIIETKSVDEEFNETNVNKEQEKLKEVEEEELQEQQKPTVLTPSGKTGGMKLIIQRKRGARFKCRRKTDDDPFAHNDHQEPTTAKRRKKSSHNTPRQTKLRTEPLFLEDLNGDYFRKEEELQQKPRYFNDCTMDSDEEENVTHSDNRKTKVPEFNSEEDENKENPIALQQEFDSDSNNSVYRDPLLIKNDVIEDDSQLTDFPKPQLSLQTECSKEMYKLYKEKTNLESPRKLIVRVPLTSLTHDFKRLHLTMDKDKQENELQTVNTDEEHPVPVQPQEQEDDNETLETQTISEQEETHHEQIISSQANTSSSQSDLLGFSQTTETSSSSMNSSSQPSMEMVRYVQPPLCSASSKINEFINDFQTNCIDSSEIEETCDMIPQLGPAITQELSDEIRDVEDTLNGILSEMHDKDMYTPRSAETDEIFPHSVYSPLTDSPTTPSHSFYAESPCTINSNPMSVSPFIHHNMDYNAMTPQSNHSSMGHGSHMGSGSGGSTGSHSVVFSEHFPTYTECFEESTQSELIGFQNDIPCFENIEITNPDAVNDILAVPAEFNEEEEVVNIANTNSIEQINATENVEVKAPTEIVDYIDLSDYKEDSDQFVDTPTTQVQMGVAPEITVPNQIPYNPANYQQLNNTPTIHMQNSANPMIATNANPQPHYIVTNTNQGPIIIANPQLNQAAEQMDGSFKPHSNNLQFVTLGQAMDSNHAQTNHLIHNNTNEINWPNSVNTPTTNYTQQPVISAANGTTTYFINANGELYQASIPNSSLNTIILPNNTAQANFNKSNMDNNDNYMQTLQQHQQRQQQNQPNQSSQYIMLVNNLGGTPQYYATTHSNLNQTVQTPQPAVLFQRAQTHNVRNDTDYPTNSPQQHSNTNSTPNQANPTVLTSKSTHVPITPANETVTDPKSGQTMHQRVNQQLQRQIKQRQLQLLQPRSPNVTQKITLVCRFCHKRPKFTNNVDYSNHIINTHPAEKPYNCPHCPMHFSRRFERQQHVAQVHGSRYQCAQCGLSFCAQRTLDFHLQKYHANLGRSQQHLQQQQQQQNSTSTSTPATYQLLQHNQRQRLVRVEDVHVQVTGENKNKRSIDLALDGSADIQTSQSMPEVELLSDTTEIQQQQQPRKLCSPDCKNDNDDCCGSNKNCDQTNNNSNDTQAENNTAQQEYAGSESVNNNQHNHHQYQHVTIPSPEQTEPDSTTTLRHFRKRQLSDISPHFATSPSSSSFNNNMNNNDNLDHNSTDEVLAGEGCGGGAGGPGEQILVERSLRGSHNCLLCEESFTNEIALRKHHHMAHGATQTTTNTAATSTALVCTICKRGFRMRNALQRHMETHDAEGRPYECNICQVRFPRPSQLTLHKLTVHKFEKPNSCEECGKQFGTESAMKAHVEEHHQYGEEEAASATTASSEAAASSSSSSSTTTQLSSRIYLDTMTTKTTSISTSTTITNEQNINLQTTTSGEDETTASTNNNIINNAALENTIVSGLAT